MEINRENLQKLQKEWFDIQEILRRTYPLLGEIDSVPGEEYLTKLDKCSEKFHHTTCFWQGSCIDVSNPGCPFNG